MLKKKRFFLLVLSILFLSGFLNFTTALASYTINKAPTSVKTVKVASISLNKTNYATIVGQTYTLLATVNPTKSKNKTMKWTSSNSVIAKVDAKGRVTALSAGTAKITVTTFDGNNTASCTFTITNKKEILKIVELNMSWKAIGQYSEGLCPVQDKISGMWGYVDKTGSYIIKPEYYKAMPFSEGLAAVKTSSGFYNFIDKAGKVIILGEFTDVLSRFGGFAGYKNGLAVVSFNKDINKRGNYTLIDTKGKIIKELDEFTTYVLAMGRFKNTGNIVTNSDRDKSIYDNQYNKVAEFVGGGSANRILFNFSSKYLIIDDRDYKDVGNGLYIGASDGSKAFEQSKISGINNTDSYKMGITDDYIVIRKTVNQIQMSAVYDYSGKMILDYKYKEIIPVNKNIFIVRNNADLFGIIDNKNKELVSFSLGINSFSWRKDLCSIYEDAKKLGGVHFIIKDKYGNENAKYFDFQSKKIKDYFMVNFHGSSSNGFAFRFNTDVGLIHVVDVGYSATIYDSTGLKIGKFDNFFATGNVGNTISKEPFLAAGIIPCFRKDKLGFTFAVIKK